MKAIVYTRYGPPEVLSYADVPKPVPGDREALVRVRAASVNFGDRAAMRGSPGIMRLAFGFPRPRKTILGRAVAGTVEAVGPGVTRFAPGDDVFGEAAQLGFAEYVAIPEKRLAAKPPEVTFEQAATLPVAGVTALAALRLGDAGPGRNVLVNGASGGVGTFTVQLAKRLGARVTAVCRARNADLVRSIGADQVIDYTTTDLTQSPERFDLIIDLAGGHPVSAMRRLLTPRGTYVATTGNGGAFLGPLPLMLAVLVTAPFVRQSLRPLAVGTDADDLARLGELTAKGEITPVIEATYPLSATAEAIRAQETAHAQGKIVLTV
ncbi:NAD(P)-dependent alcohol dehydrogenase [Spongiactinospora sp. TRM90649]|uniref:NAD(P)-dependent alcohol dehydrogenase n=1 Tax=Spongiactinospora sp. TRM90649 TaxID=3031114 RepID=UPI0023F68D59|nr:NAD(P)-dependent alcohol dehydrogenase [Spongiactinospora sp. TRM90649]MDF5756415.1 NAD(P)-dependent alcohol dehydrogenase [Spongiactinospora sp. TRM90649]